jgi:hypothetical protein
VQLRRVLILITLVDVTVTVAIHAITPSASTGGNEVWDVADWRILLHLIRVVGNEVTINAIDSCNGGVSPHFDDPAADSGDFTRNVSDGQEGLVYASVRLLSAGAA